MNKQLLESLIMKLIDGETPSSSDDLWRIGQSYFIRTVTMHLVGRLEKITDKELLLSDASWVADSGRFNNALKTGILEEVEPFVNNLIVNRNSVIDATIWNHNLPKEVK